MKAEDGGTHIRVLLKRSGPIKQGTDGTWEFRDYQI